MQGHLNNAEVPYNDCENAQGNEQPMSELECNAAEVCANDLHACTVCDTRNVQAIGRLARTVCRLNADSKTRINAERLKQRECLVSSAHRLEMLKFYLLFSNASMSLCVLINIARLVCMTLRCTVMLPLRTTSSTQAHRTRSLCLCTSCVTEL